MNLRTITGHRIISDDAIDFGRVKRRRVRVLIERRLTVDTRPVRELAELIAHRVLEKHGDQHAIAVMFYDDIFTPAGTLGSWDWCPNGVWADADTARSGDYSHHRWILDRSSLMPFQLAKQLLSR